MARDLTQIDFLSLYLGGEDGGVYVASATAVTGKQIALIEVMDDSATFSVLSGEAQNGSAIDMVNAAQNNYGVSGAWNRGDLIAAPMGGFISAFTCDKACRYFRVPDSNRSLNQN